MSSTLFLDALKKYNLQQYYPSLYSHGMSTLHSLAELSMQDCTKVGVRSIDDKRKFMALADDLKQQMRAKSSNTSTTSTARSPQQSRKRTSTTDKTPPEKHARRMTLAQQTLPRTSTSPKASSTVRTSTVAPRRLSYYSRQPALPSNRSPIRNGRATTAANMSVTAATTVSPSRVNHSKTPPKMPKYLEDLGVEVKVEEDLPQVQKSGRLLNAYGIPVGPSKRRLSAEVPGPLISYEEYIESRSPVQQHHHHHQSTITSTTTSSDLHQRIRVCVRKRPLSKKETMLGDTDVAPVVGARTIQVNAPKTKVDLTRFTEQHSFTFDDVFDSNTGNLNIYRRTALPLVEYMFSGGKATCFAYGQTGSGKTYTMLDPQHGLYVRAAHDIFAMLGLPQYAHLSAWVGFYEIYQGHLYDLLNQRNKLVPRDDGNSNVIIAGLKEFPIKDVSRLMEVFDVGSQARTTGRTGANNNSSRSHAVLQVLIKKEDGSIHGKLSFIDLAGSERGADRGEANQKTRMEGAEINKSLLALKECIRALDQDQRHTPFRGSKLTQVLRDSFVGNSRTCMIATISPNNPNSEHTLNTLRYADRVKELKGESDPRLLAEQQQESVGLVTARNDTNASMGGLDTSEHRDELASIANSDEMYDEEQTENLFDIDIPSQMSNNALATPQAHHHPDDVDDEDNADSPQRQQQYLRRLSSPPEEVFSTPIEDPFHSTPRMSNPGSSRTAVIANRGPNSMPKSPSATPSDTPQISVKHIRDFIKLHRAQLKEIEECIKLEKKMISKLSLNISSRHDFNEDDEQDCDELATTVQNYEDYLNDLDEVHERKVACVETFGERIKAELGEEEDVDMQ
ncbi:P-loop containing nucleoside triphosphate hydrolase protein [Zychaea mexicana]|uniref:P-loop containing nucleoside triphosphate hydrolase protein n=1 Tax=Zychaea mexicana TaxID=64656 RepID=UPI0022FE39CB|nr:P-loop containing nucleoside triphosphate hydrolase protein [Zychaea mexicana]KAI9494935.1 P-loop containing nucleoside triphosphate hydrolase protein [Zychaea mexicana]